MEDEPEIVTVKFKFYNLKQKSNLIEPELRLICETVNTINELLIFQGQHNGALHSSCQLGQEYCKAEWESDINTYFFEKSNLHRNYKELYESIELITNEPGVCYPRIYRPIIKKSVYSHYTFSNSLNIKILSNDLFEYLPYNERVLISSVQQLGALVKKLMNIFEYVYPTKDNMKSYGHEIRSFLILACTEVEEQLKGILIANGYNKERKQLSMEDYYKLKKVLKLEEYKIRFTYYPEIDEVSPFESWLGKKSNPFWYSDYNSVKHNREDEFEKASLTNAINSIAAVCILLTSQYGSNIPFWREQIGLFFEITKSPKWRLDDCYLPPFENFDWENRNYILNQSVQ